MNAITTLLYITYVYKLIVQKVVKFFSHYIQIQSENGHDRHTKHLKSWEIYSLVRQLSLFNESFELSLRAQLMML